jgi:hypothetical protein
MIPKDLVRLSLARDRSGIEHGWNVAAAGTYGAARVLIKCGAARRVAPSGEQRHEMPEDNEHGL